LKERYKGGIEVTGRQERRRKKLLDRTMWRARFGRGFGPVVRQPAK
jgi:hypothetical protein